MEKTKKSTTKFRFGFARLFDSSVAIQRRIMTIIAYSAAVGNTIGFLANFLLYGMTVPTAFCLGCDILVLIYLFFGLQSKYYLSSGFALLSVLVALEFPLLVFAYGPVMYPYMVLGYMSFIMLTTGRARVIVGAVFGVYDLAVIVFSHIDSFIFGEQEVSGLIGSAVVTYAVAIIALTFCMVSWQNVYLRTTEETDGITGVFSRTGFFRKAARLLHAAPSGKYSILVFDIRSFRAFNSEYGTEEGNKLLAALADAITNSFFNPVLVGRFQADRFACVVDSRNISEENLAPFCQFFYKVNEKETVSYLSCGIMPVNDSGEDIRLLCDKAASVIRFIRVGQNKFVDTFDADMENSFVEETKILKDVEKAIVDENFEPYYQPIVDPKTGEIIGAEALARWIHPEKGVIYPGIFIPILEKMEMISALDSIIISKVAQFLAKREEDGLYSVPVSANLSRVDLFNPAMVERLHQILTANGGTANKLRLEVTESALISLSNNVFDVLEGFRSDGARILVDDFGSGYSSLGLISGFDFDVIKLDKQFADHIEDSEKNRGVIRSVIDLAHNLGAKVIAEGVENERQVEFLRENGCDYIQGYYFYRPMNEESFVALINGQNS